MHWLQSKIQSDENLDALTAAGLSTFFTNRTEFFVEPKKVRFGSEKGSVREKVDARTVCSL